MCRITRHSRDVFVDYLYTWSFIVHGKINLFIIFNTLTTWHKNCEIDSEPQLFLSTLLER